jgi:hypothetical protein
MPFGSFHCVGEQIGQKGAESLAEALKSNTTLTQLDLASK